MTKLLPPSSPSGETSSLLTNVISIAAREESSHLDPRHHRGSASVLETIVNESNTCMGTGCLALPFATKQSGIVLHVCGIFAIAMWNIYSVQRLCRCLYLLPRGAVLYEDEDEDEDLLDSKPTGAINEEEGCCPALELPPSPPPFHHRPPSDPPLPRYDAAPSLPQSAATTTTQLQTIGKVRPPPPRGTSTYSRVAWYAFGPGGLFALDVLMIVLFIGVVVTFVNAIRGFLRDTPFTTGSDVLDAVAIAFVIGPMSTVSTVMQSLLGS